MTLRFGSSLIAAHGAYETLRPMVTPFYRRSHPKRRNKRFTRTPIQATVLSVQMRDSEYSLEKLRFETRPRLVPSRVARPDLLFRPKVETGTKISPLDRRYLNRS